MAQTLINLTEQVSGALPVGNGGTGATSLAGAGIELTANKGAANGYAGLNSSGLITTSLLGTGTANSTTVLTGGSWQSLTRAIVPEAGTVTTSSVSLLTTSSAWVFSGSSPVTWTLPSVSGNTGYRMLIENRGSAAITIAPAGSDRIWRLASVTTMTVAPNGYLELFNDGTYWNALSVDLINNAASLTSLPLVTPTITGYTETVQSMGTVGSSATIPALSGGTMYTATLTSATSCTLTMPTVAAGANFAIAVKQPASGTVTSLSFSPVTWPSVGAPVITQTLGAWDIFTFFCFDGSTWSGSYTQGF